MAAVCDVCGKRPGFGHNVPWSKKKTNRRWNPNIQRVRVVVGCAQAAERLHLVPQGGQSLPAEPKRLERRFESAHSTGIRLMTTE